ncbi:MAG: efflux RND transporter periplasmic adaptor subunit [Alloprevotella sp.]|nr:efflux RND transporter periplasmic adaptor subunit [Alloprevotella sp.]
MKKTILFLLAAAALVSCSNKQEMPEADNRYAVMTVGTSPSELKTSYPATIKGVQDVEIRPKVSGFITKIYVSEGQSVSRGQVLFTVDSEQYRQQVNAAQEAVNAAQQGVVAAQEGVKTAEQNVLSSEQQVNVIQANINTAELTLQNVRRQYEQKILGSDYQLRQAENNLKSLQAQLGSAKSQLQAARVAVGSAKAQVGTAQAQVGQARAQLAAARDNLSFCSVTSPANGVIGMIPLKVGALVGPSMTIPFTTVSDISRMNVYFAMNEKQLLSMTRSGGVGDAISKFPLVTLKLADGTDYTRSGRVDAIGGVIDQTTGAVQVRATFENDGRVLRSGGSGQILVPVFNSGAILVPQAATTEIQDKIFVYVVGKDNKVQSREIKVQPQHDGKNFVVTDGLKVGERIVIEGVQNLKNGTEIKPITPEESKKIRENAQKEMKEGKIM